MKRKDVEESRRVFDFIQLISSECFQSGGLRTELAIWDNTNERGKMGLAQYNECKSNVLNNKECIIIHCT